MQHDKQQGKRPLTALNFYLSAFFHHAANQGLDAARLLQDAGIARDCVDNAARRIDIAQLAAFIIAICDALQDESMALSAWPVPRGSLYMMGKVTIHEATLGKALLQMQRFFTLVTRAFTLTLHTHDGRSRLSFTPADPERDAQHLFAEMNLLMFHRFSSWLIAENIPLGEVYFSYAPPPQHSEYAFLFPGKHVFNAPAMGFTFPAHYLERPVVQNAGTLKSFMQRCPMELFTHPETDFSLASEIYHLLWKQHHAQPPTLEEIADTLHIGTRTLIRHLKLEGSSYQEIKDRVRRDKAIHYLTSQSITMSEIAERLGFSDARVFTRAFRSWTGVSPSRYRDEFIAETRTRTDEKAGRPAS
jgi:AraC-like DNA-binding protein